MPERRERRHHEIVANRAFGTLRFRGRPSQPRPQTPFRRLEDAASPKLEQEHRTTSPTAFIMQGGLKFTYRLPGYYGLTGSRLQPTPKNGGIVKSFTCIMTLGALVLAVWTPAIAQSHAPGTKRTQLKKANHVRPWRIRYKGRNNPGGPSQKNLNSKPVTHGKQLNPQPLPPSKIKLRSCTPTSPVVFASGLIV